LINAVSWREVELEALRDVRQTLLTFTPENTASPFRKTYPIGATLIAQASLLSR